jgi:hypothetical protein
VYDFVHRDFQRGQVMAREYTFPGSEPIRTRGKEKQMRLQGWLSDNQQNTDQDICLYLDTNLTIFHKYHEQTYQVLNFSINLNQALFQIPVESKDLLPIYYGDRLGLILKQVRQTDPQGSQPTKSPTPGTARRSSTSLQSTESAKSSAAAKQYLLAFQKTTPNKEGLYEFDYLTLSQQNLNDLLKASKNPTKVTEVRESNDTSGPKFVFTIKSFKNPLYGTYYLSLELKSAQFLTTPAN